MQLLLSPFLNQFFIIADNIVITVLDQLNDKRYYNLYKGNMQYTCKCKTHQIVKQ